MTLKQIVAIDGPSGVGKSTTSRKVASSLGVPQIDTGAMYRAIALSAIEQGIDLQDDPALVKLIENSGIEFRIVDGESRIFMNERDISSEIRAPRISMAASDVSARPAVRRLLVKLQRDLGESAGGVLEGRDIGTKVFPDTPHKFYLDARPEIRAGRRARELEQKGSPIPFQQVLDEMVQRDHQDSSRADSPLSYDDSYSYIDTSEMTLDEVVQAIVDRVSTRG